MAGASGLLSRRRRSQADCGASIAWSREMVDSPVTGAFMLGRVSALLGIGDFSRLTSGGVATRRHYGVVGLVWPGELDRGTGYRRYAITQVPAAQVIRRLRELDMSLDEVRVVMEAPDVGARNAAISAHLRRVEGQLERTRATVRALRVRRGAKPPPG